VKVDDRLVCKATSAYIRQCQTTPLKGKVAHAGLILTPGKLDKGTDFS